MTSISLNPYDASCESVRRAIIDGLGAALLRSPDSRTLAAWRSLALGEKTFEEWKDGRLKERELLYLTIDTTGMCDLTCPQMCYYNPQIAVHRAAAPIEVLEQAIGEAAGALKLKNLVFAGKEPLLNASRLFRLMRFAATLPNRGFAVGMVTNGRNIAKYFDELRSVVAGQGLNFVDISLDSGEAAQHDGIRGQAGTFAKAVNALRLCHTIPALRVGIASVLRHDNADGLLALLRETYNINQKFFITPVQPPTFSQMRPLEWSYVGAFLKSLLHLLETELADAGLEVMVSLLGLYLFDAERDGFFRWEEFCEDSQGQCYIPRECGGNRVLIHAQVLPETGWGIARITYTGAYLPNTHFLQDATPEHHAVGFVQRESIGDLYQRATSLESVLQKVLESRTNHDCLGRPCWSACFGGLTGAEHSFVGGKGLRQQPHLCTKVAADFEGSADLG